VRRLYKDQVLAGFAGGTADAFTLFERFEGKLEKHQGHLTRALSNSLRIGARTVCCAGSKRCWRWRIRPPRSSSPARETSSNRERAHRHRLGRPYAQSAARALLENSELDARAIVERALAIAADICIYTNRNVTIEELSL